MHIERLHEHTEQLRVHTEHLHVHTYKLYAPKHSGYITVYNRNMYTRNSITTINTCHNDVHTI